MKTTTHTRAIFAVALAAFLTVFAGTNLLAQNFENCATGTYTAGATGTIIMKDQNGLFTDENGSGTGANALGFDAASQIDGIVVWEQDNAQAVQGRFYTDLQTRGGGAKTFSTINSVGATNNEIHVRGTYTSDQDGGGGSRTYTGTDFYYDGPAPQEVEDENTGNGTGYAGLYLANVTSISTRSGETVEVTDEFTHTTSAFTNNGIFNILAGTGDDTHSSDQLFTNANNATFNYADGGTYTFDAEFVNDAGGAGGGVDSDAGILDFNDDYTNTSGPLNLSAASQMNVAAGFTRTTGVFTFDDESDFYYDGGAQTLLLTDGVDFAAYGNVFLTGTGAKSTSETSGEFNIAGNFDTDVEVDMDDSDDGTGAAIVMLNDDGTETVTYTGGVEVRGRFQHQAILAGVDYTYNNTGTVLAFQTAPAAGEYVELNIRQQTAPTYAGGAGDNRFDTDTDINRFVEVNYTGTSQLNKMNVQWESTDEVAFTGDRNLFRYVEGYAANTDYQKIIRQGASYDRTGAGASPRILVYAGGSNNGIDLNGDGGVDDVNSVANGSQVIITATPQIFISVIDGRWTNPDTWDVGQVPTENDNAEIETHVYIGIDGPAYGSLGDGANDNVAVNNTQSEADYLTAQGGTYMINQVQINDMAEAALIMGNEDNGANYSFETRLSGSLGGREAGIFNSNTTPNSGDYNDRNETSDLNGLILVDMTQLNGLNLDGDGADGTPTTSTAQIYNCGSVINYGIIEIGE